MNPSEKSQGTTKASVRIPGDQVKVAVQSRGGVVLTSDDRGAARVLSIRTDEDTGIVFVKLETRERIVDVAIYEEEGKLQANVDGLTFPVEAWPARLPELLTAWQLRNQDEHGDVVVKAPLTGVVRDVLIKKGQELKEGDPCVVIEAMKMENILPAPHDGKVKKISIKTDASVRPGEPLFELEVQRDESAVSEEIEEIPHLPGGRLLTARERVEHLFDPGSFREIDAHVRHRVSDFGLDRRDIPGDGVICGYGKVDGRTVYAYSQDFRALGGSLGEMHARKICKVLDLATQSGHPVVGIHDSGGARIQEGVLSLAGYGDIFLRVVKASGIIPQIACILGPSAGGAVYSPAMMDFVVMTESNSNMFLTGPRVVKTVTFEDITADELGGGRVHGEITGVAHVLSPNEAEALQSTRRLISYLPNRSGEPAPRGPKFDPADRSTPNLVNLVPDDTAQAYDCREVIRQVFDHGSFFEIHERFAPNLVVGMARLAGTTVGVVANQPAHLAGCLDSTASRKGARFIRFCDAFSIPIISLVDVPGFMPGREQEHGGVISHGAKLLYAYCESSVPKLSVIVRKAYGGAYIVMSSKHIGGDLNFSWPDAEIAVMGAKGAVEILHRRDLAQHGAESEEIKDHIDAYENKFLTPNIASAHGFIDRVIDPQETRVALTEGLAAMKHLKKTGPDRVHGNMPT